MLEVEEGVLGVEEEEEEEEVLVTGVVKAGGSCTSLSEQSSSTPRGSWTEPRSSLLTPAVATEWDVCISAVPHPQGEEGSA